MRLFTIGYEGASVPGVIGTLRQAGVALLIDVRDRPQSRRPGFSKKSLSASLEEAGIGYLHLKPLGTPAEGREANKRGDMELFWHIVAEQLSRPEAQAALAEAAEAAASRPACLLCLEADHRHCHRARVAELLRQRAGFSIEHLAVSGEAAF